MDSSKLDQSVIGSSVQSEKAMASADKKGSSSFGGHEELFKLNQLWYKMPPSLSLVSKRTLTKGYFTQTAFPKATSRVLQLVVNSGEFYVNTRTSYLVIQCGIDKSAAGLGADKNARALIGQGDICSLFNEVYFTSASGTEICREQEKQLCNSVVQRQMLSQEYIDSQGELSGWPGDKLRKCFDLKGYGGSTTSGDYKFPLLYPLRNKTYQQLSTAGSTSATLENTSYGSLTGTVDLAFDPTDPVHPAVAPTFIVPMHRLLSCFNPYMSVLFPAAALAGGVLTIRMNDLSQVLIASGSGLPTTAAATDFLKQLDIQNIYVLWDSFQLNDSVLKRLNEVSAGTEGLSVMFDAWDWTSTTTSGTSVEAQVSSGKSRIIRSVCIPRDQAEKNNPWSNKLASEAAIKRVSGYDNGYQLNTGIQPLVATYQAQLGSLYFPQQPLVSPEEFVMNAYYVYCKGQCDESDLSSLTKDDFYGALGNGHFAGDGSINNPNTMHYITPGVGIATPSNTPPWTQNWGIATYGFVAERSQLLQLTGLPISNARLLRHRFTFNYLPVSGSARTIDVFTQYTRVMKVFLGGRIVMRE